MKIELLREYVDSGREIEFKFDDEMYSVTYGIINGVDVISFCEFYKESTEVKSVEDLLEVSRKGKTVAQMWQELSSDDIWVY